MHNVDTKLEDLGKLLKGEQKEEEKKVEAENTDEEDEEENEMQEPNMEGLDLEGAGDSSKFMRDLGTESYITFAEFTKIMSLFNPRTAIDEKIHCKFELRQLTPPLVYFRIFDCNKDKKID